MGEIDAAVERYTKKKNAAGVMNNEIAGKEATRLVVSGADLDLAELEGKGGEFAAAALVALASGVPIQFVLQGLWCDGLVTGVLLEEART
jgi:hypothetical protein